MNTDYTHVSILLDRSGSMGSIVDDMIGGFNSFIDKQKELPGKMTVSAAQFDTEYDVLYNMAEIGSVKKLTQEVYYPRGSTALYDSLNEMMRLTGNALFNMKESDRPWKVMFVIITDGEENASRFISKETIAEKIRHQTEQYGWGFIYMGCDQDAFKEGAKIGVQGLKFRRGATGMAATYASLSSNVGYNRSYESGQSVTSLTQDEVDEEGGQD